MRAWIDRTAHIHGPLLFIGGGVWDYYTLQLERLADNGLLLVYLLLFAAITALDLRRLDGQPLPAFANRWSKVIGLAAQFALGGLLSAYFVHYFRGAPVQRELFWLMLLGALAILNEVADRYEHLALLRLPLLAFASFNYFLAVLPLLTGSLVGPAWPLLGSTVIIAGTVIAASWRVRIGPEAIRACVTAMIALGAQLFLVATDRVPPLPLTLKSAEVTSEAIGDHYELDGATELLAPIGLFRPKLVWIEGHTVRVRTPIYLPKGMETTIVHRWTREDPTGWVDTDRIALDVRGGREEGFRTFSLKRRTSPGRWQVVVETEDGRELGRVTFDLVEVEVPEEPDPASL